MLSMLSALSMPSWGVRARDQWMLSPVLPALWCLLDGSALATSGTPYGLFHAETAKPSLSPGPLTTSSTPTIIKIMRNHADLLQIYDIPRISNPPSLHPMFWSALCLRAIWRIANRPAKIPTILNSVDSNDETSVQGRVMLQPNGEYDSHLDRIQVTMIEATAHDWLSNGGRNFDLAILVLASLNILAAVLTVASIFYNAWSTKEWDFYPKTRKVFNFVPVVHPADVLPLAFSVAIVVQGIVLVGISAKESQEAVSHRCNIVAQFVWPVLWIASYTTLVFALDISFRSLYRIRFTSHGRWHMPMCVVGVLLLTFVTWIPSNVLPSNDPCVSSLIWWTADYAEAGVAITVTLIATYIICTAVITVNLLKQSKLDRDERLQASIVVYYLIVNTLILSLVLPFYSQIFMDTPAIHASKLAEIALNIGGIISGLIRIVIRTNADWTLIPHVKKCCFKKRPRTIFAPSDLDIYDHMTSPISPQDETDHSVSKDLEKSGTVPSQGRTPHCESPHKIYASAPRITETTVVAPPPRLMLSPSTPPQRSNYSIFPAYGSTLTRESGSTMFSMGYEDVEPPRPLFTYSHKRILSNQTSATVEIGYRLSHTNPALQPDELSPTSTNVPFSFQATPSSAYRWDYAGDGGAALPGEYRDSLGDIAILPTQPNEPRTPSQISGPMSEMLSPSWFHRNGTILGFQSKRRERNIMKSLPPVPRNVSGSHDSVHSSYKPPKLALERELNDSTQASNSGR